MSGIILGFSSKMGSGRSEISKKIAEEMELLRVSFGEYIRSLARQKGLSETREVLQEIGQNLISEDCERFCHNVLHQVEWKPGQSLVVDGIRHKEVEEVLEEMVKPSKLFIIFIDANDSIRLNRLRKENITEKRDIERIESHSTEIQAKTILPKIADIRIPADQPLNTLVSDLIKWVDELADGEIPSTHSPTESVSKKIAELAASNEDSAITTLQEYLLQQNERLYHKHDLPRLVCRALLYKGSRGIQVLVSTLQQALSIGYSAAILESLWHAAQGYHPPNSTLRFMCVVSPLDKPLLVETITKAREVFYELVSESQINEELFNKLLHFLYQNNYYVNFTGKASARDFRFSVFEVFAESSFKITKKLISEFEKLINDELLEKEYQQFLINNPVFIDPLAHLVIDRQRLGLEHTTDFVVQRLDNEYILVEIEKPQDSIFTAKNDFTAEFTHAFGQVVDFLEWVDTNPGYARNHMPQISSPKGLLIMGRKKNLSPQQTAKLKRYCINSQSIKILTYDDLIENATVLYNNIRKKQTL